MLFPDLQSRLNEVRQKIEVATARGGHGQSVKIIAVTKTHGPDTVLAAMAAGIIDLGENKVQEAIGKQDSLAGKAAVTGGMQSVVSPVAGQEPEAGGRPRWHLIGHLQRNKVKFLDRFSLFHAVDSERLAEAIDEFGLKQPQPIDVLIELNVSGEASKGGLSTKELSALSPKLSALKGLRVVGAMTMAPFDADEATLRAVFSGARDAREMLRQAGLPAAELSMGMSGDYEMAVEEGATMVRLGTVLFGTRESHKPASR